MHATKGDQLVQHGRTVGQHDKVAEITEVMGAEGAPPTACGSRTVTRPCARRARTPRSATGTCRSRTSGTYAGRPAGSQSGGFAGCR